MEVNDKYYEQQLRNAFLNSEVFKQSSGRCQATCLEGWNPINENLRICVPCIRNCSVCFKSMLRYRSLCMFSCPKGSEPNENNSECLVSNENKLKLILYAGSVYKDYVSTSRDTTLEIYILNYVSFLNNPIEGKVKAIDCFLNYPQSLEQGKVFVQIKGITFM